jgi:hypothetical protein
MDYQRLYGHLGGGGLWFIPICAGAVLILFGVLILIVPNLLEYVVAGALLLAGFSLLGVGWRGRTRVSFRRLDENEQNPPPL